MPKNYLDKAFKTRTPGLKLNTQLTFAPVPLCCYRQLLQLSLLRALNLPTTAPSGGTFDTQSKLPPDHFVHDTHVALDDADDFGADVLVHVVGDGDAGETVADEGDGDVHALKQTLRVDAAEHDPSTPLRSRSLIRAQGRGW